MGTWLEDLIWFIGLLLGGSYIIASLAMWQGCKLAKKPIRETILMSLFWPGVLLGLAFKRKK